jgi:hypothetical protein
MAICDHCGKDMLEIDDCSANRGIKYHDGEILPSSTFHFNEQSGRCHDCGIRHGGYHHPGCDVERCPRCGGHLISCKCFSGDSPWVNCCLTAA